MTTPIITTPPAAPQRSSPSTFSTRADAFLSWWIAAITELNAALGWVNTQIASITSTSTYWSSAQALASSVINCSAGVYFTKTISASTTFSFSNVPASGQAYSCTLRLTHSAGTITWPATVIWPEALPPILSTGKVHLFVFTTDNGGVTWRGSCLPNFAS